MRAIVKHVAEGQHHGQVPCGHGSTQDPDARGPLGLFLSLASAGSFGRILLTMNRLCAVAACSKRLPVYRCLIFLTPQSLTSVQSRFPH